MYPQKLFLFYKQTITVNKTKLFVFLECCLSFQIIVALCNIQSSQTQIEFKLESKLFAIIECFSQGYGYYNLTALAIKDIIYFLSFLETQMIFYSKMLAISRNRHTVDGEGVNCSKIQPRLFFASYKLKNSIFFLCLYLDLT